MDRNDIQPLLLEVVHRRVERHPPPVPAAAVGGPPPRVVDDSSRIARAAEANRKLRSAALSRTDSPSRRITASWTTAVGERVWSARSRRISRVATRRSSS